MGEPCRLNDDIRHSDGKPPLEAALAALAAAQWGVVSLPDLAAIGVSERAARYRAEVGRLHRQYAGVYSLVPRNLLTREGLWLAAVLACGEGAVLSHRSAAALHGLVPSGGRRIDVTVPTNAKRNLNDLKVHRSKTLTERDTTKVKNIPCTTVGRTQFDLAESVDTRTLERAFDQAEILEVFDLRAIEDQIRRNPTRPAAGRVRNVLAKHVPGTTATVSELEERFLARCRESGIPQPEVNAWIVLPDGEPAICGDFVWRDQRVILEVDGRRTHGTRQAFERDRRRDQRAMAAGWRVPRTTWLQLELAPEEVIATLIALLGL